MSAERNLGRIARNGSIIVDTAQALRDLEMDNIDFLPRVETLGALTVGDGGGHAWHWEPSATNNDDTGEWLLPTGHVGPGRWRNSEPKERVQVVWFGVKDDFVSAGNPGTDNSGAMQAAIDCAERNNANELQWPEGNYYVGQALIVFNRPKFRCIGYNVNLLRYTELEPNDPDIPAEPNNWPSDGNPGWYSRAIFYAYRTGENQTFEGFGLRHCMFGIVVAHSAAFTKFIQLRGTYCNNMIAVGVGWQNSKVIECEAVQVGVPVMTAFQYQPQNSATNSGGLFTANNTAVFADGIEIYRGRYDGGGHRCPAFDHFVRDTLFRPDVGGYYPTNSPNLWHGDITADTAFPSRWSVLWAPYRWARVGYGLLLEDVEIRRMNANAASLPAGFVLHYTSSTGPILKRPFITEMSPTNVSPELKAFLWVRSAKKFYVERASQILSITGEPLPWLVYLDDSENELLTSLENTFFEDSSQVDFGALVHWLPNGLGDPIPQYDLKGKSTAEFALPSLRLARNYQVENYSATEDRIRFWGNDLHSMKGHRTYTGGLNNSDGVCIKTQGIFGLPHLKSDTGVLQPRMGIALYAHGLARYHIRVYNTVERDWDEGIFECRFITSAMNNPTAKDINNGDTTIAFTKTFSTNNQYFMPGSIVNIGGRGFVLKEIVDNGTPTVIELYAPATGLTAPIPAGSAVHFEYSGQAFNKIKPFSRSWVELVYANYCPTVQIKNPEANLANNVPYVVYFEISQTEWTPKWALSTAAPTTGKWERGAIVYNQNPNAGGALGWICVSAGEPGTWKKFGTIEA